MLFAYALRVYWFGSGVILLIRKMRDEAFMKHLDTPAKMFWASFYLLFVMPWMRLFTFIRLFPIWIKIRWINLQLRLLGEQEEEPGKDETAEETSKDKES